jgi:SAM-dependent methyltransferase
VPARWSGPGYAQASGHHRTADEWFLRRRPPAAADVVIDLGSGSGEFTARLAELVPDGRVIGVDADPSMIAAARRHVAPNLEFVQARAEEVDSVMPAGSADLVVSRAMLHWLPASTHGRLFRAVFTVLRPSGWVHLEAGGMGNVPSFGPLLEDVAVAHRLAVPPPFPDTGRVFELVEVAGFSIPDEGVRTVAQRRPFTREQLVGVLLTQVSLALTRQLPDADSAEAHAVVADVVAGVDRLRRHDGSFDQTFVRLDVLAQRPV